MPELPEVQTTVNGITAHVKGLSITDAWTDYKSRHAKKDTISNPAYFVQFRKAIKGARITGASRRAKNVLVHLSNDKTILIHMKMTGHVMYGKYKKLPRKDHQGESWRPVDTNDKALNDPFNRFLHLVLSLSNGKHLVLSDMRKFAKVTLIHGKDAADIMKSSHLSAHGPEPLEDSFDAKRFKEAIMKKPTGRIKVVLMDHTVISGIGNIYSDEILWLAGIHPLSRVAAIPTAQWPLMYKAMRKTLARGIDFGGDSMSDYRNILGQPGAFQAQHNAYRKTGTRCGKPRCTGTITRIKVGGRSGHYCNVHQKLYT